MNAHTCLLLFAPVVVLGLHVGCDRDRTGSTRTTSASLNTVPESSAARAMANARCDREVTCNRVGSDLRYINRDACLDDLTSKGQEDIRAANCPTDIERTRLEACLAYVREQPCAEALDKIGTLESCRSQSLCAEAP